MKKILNFVNNHSIAIMFAFLFMFIFSTHFALDPDMYWHLKSGEWITANGLPEKDPFSYWGGNFIAHEWLFDVIFNFIYNIIGFVGTQVILFLSVGVITLISVYLAENNKKSCWIFYLIPLYMLYVHAGIIVPRPHMVSTFIIIMQILLLEKSNHKFLWLLPIFTLFITNIHGASVFILIIIAAVYFLNYILENIGNLDKKVITKYIVAILFMALTLLATPYGLESIGYGSKLPEETFSYIYEWQPIIQGTKDILYLFLILLPIACMAYLKETKIKDVMMLCLGMMLTFIWLRMIIIYAFIYIIFGVPYIDGAVRDVFGKLKLNSKIKNFKFPIANIVSIMLCGLFIVSICTMSLEKSENNSVIAPKVIKNYIKENNVDIENNVMFNHYNFGGYFIYHDMKVFIDGRNDVYSKEFGSPDVFPDYIDILYLENNAQELIEKYNIKYFSVYKGYDLYNYLIENGATELVSDDTYAFLEYK